MNNKVVLAAIMAMSLPLTDAAFGQGGSPGYPPSRDEPTQRGEQQRQPTQPSPPGQSRNAPSAQRDQMRPKPPSASRDRQPPPPRGTANDRRPPDAGPGQGIHRGERLPSRYRGKSHVVRNWQSRHLSRPPRGYHWVRTGPDYVLVTISSGIIARIVSGR